MIALDTNILGTTIVEYLDLVEQYDTDAFPITLAARFHPHIL